MRMILRYESGARVQAALLAASAQKMRVAIESQDDSVELERIDNDLWQTSDGETIEIEALVQIPDTDVSRFCRETRPRTLTAGSGFISF
jgi:hypothetical protein